MQKLEWLLVFWLGKWWCQSLSKRTTRRMRDLETLSLRSVVDEMIIQQIYTSFFLVSMRREAVLLQVFDVVLGCMTCFQQWNMGKNDSVHFQRLSHKRHSAFLLREGVSSIYHENKRSLQSGTQNKHIWSGLEPDPWIGARPAAWSRAAWSCPV